MQLKTSGLNDLSKYKENFVRVWYYFQFWLLRHFQTYIPLTTKSLCSVLESQMRISVLLFTVFTHVSTTHGKKRLQLHTLKHPNRNGPFSHNEFQSIS